MKVFPRFPLLLLAATLAISFSATTFAGDDWRAVTPEELAMKTPKVEPDADAEAIFWEVKIDDSSADELSLQHYVRVKIFTEQGREKYSKFDIPFTKGMKIKDVAARVTRPDGSAVEIRKNVPARRSEPRMPPENQVVPWMLLQSVRINITDASLSGFTITIKDPSNPVSYWGSVGREKAFLTKFMNKPDREIKKVAA